MVGDQVQFWIGTYVNPNFFGTFQKSYECQWVESNFSMAWMRLSYLFVYVVVGVFLNFKWVVVIRKKFHIMLFNTIQNHFHWIQCYYP